VTATFPPAEPKAIGTPHVRSLPIAVVAPDQDRSPQSIFDSLSFIINIFSFLLIFSFG